MTALLAFLSRAWPYLLPFVAGLLLGGWLVQKADGVRYSILEHSYAAYKAKAEDEYQQLKLKADAETAAKQKEADDAHKAFLQEQSDSAAYRASHPIGVVRLCGAPANSGTVPKGTGQVSGAPRAGLPAAVGSAMHASDPVPIENRGPLLDAFAALLDATQGKLAECKAQLK